MLAWTSETQVMAKRRAGSPTGSLTLDQKKSRIDHNYLATDNRWKAIDESYNFALDCTSIRGLFAKLCVPKSRESPLARFWDSHAGVPGEKSHLDVGLVERSRVYYKGEGGGFPQVWAVVSLVCPCCPWLVLAPKVLQLCTNHFV